LQQPRRYGIFKASSKKASEFAQEAEGVWSQLSKYAGLADQLEQHITMLRTSQQKPKLFGKLDLVTTRKKPSTPLKQSIS
jgi:hypothetical protein